MSDFDSTFKTQLDTIQSRLGMSLEEAAKLVQRTGLTHPKDIRWMFEREYGIKHEEAKMLVTALFAPHSQAAM